MFTTGLYDVVYVLRPVRTLTAPDHCKPERMYLPMYFGSFTAARPFVSP